MYAYICSFGPKLFSSRNSFCARSYREVIWFCVIRDSANLITNLGFARSYCGIHREPAVLGGEEGEEVGEQVAEQRDQRVVVAERAAGEVRRVAPLVGEQL